MFASSADRVAKNSRPSASRELSQVSARRPLVLNVPTGLGPNYSPKPGDTWKSGELIEHFDRKRLAHRNLRPIVRGEKFAGADRWAAGAQHPALRNAISGCQRAMRPEGRSPLTGRWKCLICTCSCQEHHNRLWSRPGRPTTGCGCAIWPSAESGATNRISPCLLPLARTRRATRERSGPSPR